MQVQSLGQEDPLEEGMQSTPVFMPGESHVQRSLMAATHGLQRVGHDCSDLACMHFNGTFIILHCSGHICF